MQNETVRPATPGQIKDIMATLIGAMPSKLSYGEAQGVIARKGKLIAGIRSAFKEFQAEFIPGAWRTLEIGGESKERLLARLKDTPVKIWATKMIERTNFPILPQKTRIGIVVKTVSELGFTHKPTHPQVVARGLELGLVKCPPETGIYLWLLQEELELPDEYYEIAMDTFLDASDRQSAFALSIYTSDPRKQAWNHWLKGASNLRYGHESEDKFIFCLPH